MSSAALASGAWKDRPSLAPPKPSPEDLSRLVRRGFALRRFVPPALPEVATQVLNLSGRPDVAFDVLARLVERDPMLSAQILRMMQSSVYNRGVKVTSIEQAIGRLGIGALRDLVAQVSFDRVVYATASYGAAMDQLRWHGTVVAHLSRLVADEVGYDNEYVYLAGLLHDIGLPASLLMVSLAYPKGAPSLEDVWPELLRIHEQTGWRLAKLWELPEPLRAALRYHHSVVDSAPDPLTSSVVCVADRLACACGAGVKPYEDGTDEAAWTPDDSLQEACLRLGVTQGTLERLVASAQELVTALDDAENNEVAMASTVRSDDIR